jgi:hypothetical protein
VCDRERRRGETFLRPMEYVIEFFMTSFSTINLKKIGTPCSTLFLEIIQ